jgi:hypothetical protein
MSYGKYKSENKANTDLWVYMYQNFVLGILHVDTRVSIHKRKKNLTTTIKKYFLLYTQLNATMSEARMKVILHADILSFDDFEIYD